MTWEKFSEKLFWLMLLAVCGYAANQIRSGASSVNELNLKVAVIIEQLSVQNETIKIHESRIERLEARHAR